MSNCSALVDLIRRVEQLERDGAVVLLKWDGGRQNNCRTVVITRAETDYVWRKDSENIAETLAEALIAYEEKHAPGAAR